jgi:pimeloyl-ACP methyl ester carboxylesterase
MLRSALGTSSLCHAARPGRLQYPLRVRTAPPEPPPIAGVRRSVVTARGVDFHVTEAGPLDGAPVLCLHGWPQHHYAYRDLLADPPEGLRIIAPDLPGYGWSGPPPHRWQKEEVASDLLALLDELGLQRVVLVGHDWGGYVGNLMVLRAPERFSAYMPLNIVHPWITARILLPQIWRFAIYHPAIGFAGVPIQRYTRAVSIGIWISLWDRTTMTGAEIRWFGDRFRDPVCAQAGSDTYRTAILEELPALRRNPETRRSHVPTRALFGAHDTAIHHSLAAAQSANADDYELELVSDSGHFIVDEKPQLVRERLVALVSEFPPA